MHRDPIFAPTGVTAPWPETRVNTILRLGRSYSEGFNLILSTAHSSRPHPEEQPSGCVSKEDPEHTEPSFETALPRLLRMRPQGANRIMCQPFRGPSKTSPQAMPRTVHAAAHSTRTRGSFLSRSINSVSAQTTASRRSGERPEVRPEGPKSHSSSSSSGNAPTWRTRPCA